MANYSTYFHCPDCKRKGVSLRLGKEDGYGCRYCDWWAFTAVDMEIDAKERKRLREANLDHPSLASLPDDDEREV